MAVLVKTEILQLIEEGKLAFNPELDRWQVQPHSVDLRLGFTFLVPKQAQMTIKGREAIRVDHLQIKAGNSRYFEVIELEEGQYFELLPREHVTVVSLEKIKLSAGLMAVLYPRSSVNRRGLTVDLSGIVDAGYEGQLVVPMGNNTDQVIRVYPGERFCQLVFQRLEREVGVLKSRWHGRDVAQGLVKERYNREVTLVRRGKIRELKKRYAIGG